MTTTIFAILVCTKILSTGQEGCIFQNNMPIFSSVEQCNATIDKIGRRETFQAVALERLCVKKEASTWQLAK